MTDEKDKELTEEEIAKLSEEFSDGGIPKAIREEVLEYRRNQKSNAGRKRKEVMRTKKGIKTVKKIDLFLEEFLRNGGNATQAALKVFDCSSVASASSIGSKYLKKARTMARVYMEKQGYGYGKMIDVAAGKMEDSKSPEWWDRLMKMAGYEDFLNTGKNTPVAVNVFQAHKSVASEYIDGEVEVADEVEQEKVESELVGAESQAPVVPPQLKDED